MTEPWVPLIEGIRTIARQSAGIEGDNFDRLQLSRAVGILVRAAREGTIRGEGVRYLDATRTALNPEDWHKLEIHPDNRLDDPHRNLRAFPVRIVNVVVDADDVRRIAADCRPASAPLNPPSNPTRAKEEARSSSTPDPGSQTRRPVRRGRRPKADWARLKDDFKAEILRQGSYPGPGGPAAWSSQTDAIAFLELRLEHYGEVVEGATTLKERTRKMLDELWEEIGGKG